MAPLTLRQALVALLAAVAGTLAVRFARDLPWSLAAVVGVAIGVLAVSTLRTSERLRGLSDPNRRRRWPPER